MEYKVLFPNDKKYPKKLKERLDKWAGEPAPTLYYSGPLKFLDKFTMAVISADAIGGVGLMATNQVLFTVREYAINYIGAHQSVMETEIFRLGLWHKYHNTVTLFSAKGLAVETYKSFLLDRFYPPLDKFPERDEYFRRAENDELLMLSITDPNEKRQLRQNILKRNWIACNLADIVFIPFGEKGSKTYTVAKKLVKTNIPVFTTDSEVNKDIHELGIHGLNRKTVRDFLEKHSAKVWVMDNKPEEIIQNYTEPAVSHSYVKEPKLTQMDLLEKNSKKKDAK